MINQTQMNPQIISVLGSHSALDICRGAKNLGFKTLVVTQKGREKTYTEYYKTSFSRHTHAGGSQTFDTIGCVDECLILERFYDILKPEIQDKLKSTIFIPNRSFEAYLKFDYESIKNKFNVPIFGNKYLLSLEERDQTPNQYNILQNAEIRFPKHFRDPQSIDRLCIIKVSEKAREYERAFFLSSSYTEYKQKSNQMISSGKITQEALDKAIIEEFVLGASVNFNFFYSPVSDRLELIGTDTRRQTNLEGILRLPAISQSEILAGHSVTYEEAGHIAVTVLESLLEKAFELGKRFIQATQELCPPGIIGPFALQSMITAGPPKKDIVVIDVSARMPGSPGINATPYSTYLYGEPISMGMRVAMEIQAAIGLNKLNLILT